MDTVATQRPAPGAGVIWITGYSGAGKTTVGRNVEALLRQSGVLTIFLDGDDLRSILAHQWGYERDQRIDLARVYFRLCSHLAAQGYTVVISAVAMYEEVFDWVRTNIPRNLQVYLNVPEEVRIRRDRATKNIYSEKVNFSQLYDTPKDVDLVLDNHGAITPAEIARSIVEKYMTIEQVDRDLGRRDHWGTFYSKAAVPAHPSPFAEHVAAKISQNSKLLEIGCGNGRDASFFARKGHSVSAIDLSEVAIEKCKVDHGSYGIHFVSGSLDSPSSSLGNNFDVIYSRFVLHAMPIEEEIATLNAANTHLRSGGTIHIECRSINDPLAREGEVLSPTERIHGHYRRFIILSELQDRLKIAGFEIMTSLESNGLAVFGKEDPVVIRIEARKL